MSKPIIAADLIPGSEEEKRIREMVALAPFVPQFLAETSQIPIYNATKAMIHIIDTMPLTTISSLLLILRNALPKDSYIPETLHTIMKTKENALSLPRSNDTVDPMDLVPAFFPEGRLSVNYVGLGSIARIVSDNGTHMYDSTATDDDDEIPDLMD
jgi:hypothetical protein